MGMGRGAIGYYEVWSESNFWGDTLDCCSEHCRYPVLPGSNSKFRINEMRTPLLLTIEILIPASMQPPVVTQHGVVFSSSCMYICLSNYLFMQIRHTALEDLFIVSHAQDAWRKAPSIWPLLPKQMRFPFYRNYPEKRVLSVDYTSFTNNPLLTHKGVCIGT